MNTARIVFRKDGIVTLNGERVGVIERGQAFNWRFTADNAMGLTGSTFGKDRLDEIRTTLYMRLSAPLSGR